MTKMLQKLFQRQRPSDSSNFFVRRILWPLLLSLCVGVLIGSLKDAGGDTNVFDVWAEACLGALITYGISFYTFQARDDIKLKEGMKLGLERLDTEVERRASLLAFALRDIGDQNHFKVFYEKQFERVADRHGGGLLIDGVSDSDYLTILREAFEQARQDFFSTLTNRYLPSWFFNDEGMTTAQKKKYLSVINRKNDGIKPTRLMIFKEDRLRNDLLHTLKPNQIVEFFELNRYVDLFFVDRDYVNEHIEYDGSLIADLDYVVFDDFLVIKRLIDEKINGVSIDRLLVSTTRYETHERYLRLMNGLLRDDFHMSGGKVMDKEEMFDYFNLDQVLNANQKKAIAPFLKRPLR